MDPAAPPWGAAGTPALGRAFAMLKGAVVVSSLEEDSTRRGRGRVRSELEALLCGRGEKLPGALGGGRVGCILMEILGGLLHIWSPCVGRSVCCAATQ